MLFKSFFESQIAFNPSMLLRFFPFKYNLVGYQVYCTSIFTANCNLRGTFWPILRSVFASLVDVFQALRWFQRGRGFKRRRRCCCIPNFPNPQLGFSSCIREKVSTNLRPCNCFLFTGHAIVFFFAQLTDIALFPSAIVNAIPSHFSSSQFQFPMLLGILFHCKRNSSAISISNFMNSYSEAL